MVQGEGTNPQVGKVTVDEFAARIKEKYPEYQEVDNLELAKAIVEKYPEYEPVVSFEPIDAAPVKKKEGAIPSPSLDGESPSTPSALETAVARTNTFMQPVYDVADWVNVNIPVWSQWASISTQMSGGITSALDALVKEATLYFAPDSPYKESIKQQIKEKGVDAAIDTPLEDLANNMREYGGEISANRKENYGVALEDQEKGIVGNALEGNWYNAAVLAVDGMVEGMIQAGLASVTGIAPLAVSAGGEKYYDVSNKKDYSSTERLLYSTSVGLMEGLVETIFRTDINAFKKVLDSDIALKSFEEELLRAAKNTPWYKEFLKAGTEEGFEEALTESFGQVLTGLKEGTRPDPVALAEAFVMGFLPGAGTHVITNGISAIGSEKRTKRRQQLNKQIEELRAKAEETEDPVQKGIIEDMVKGDIEDLNKEIELDAELYGNFSDEDAKEVQKINTEIRNLYQKVGLAVSPEQKEKYKGQILDARSRKLEIENRYSEEPVRYIKDGRMVTKAQFVEMINAATPEELSTGQWGVENDPDVEKLLLSKLPQGDTKKEAGVPSTQQAGQAPIQAQPIQEGGVEAPPTGGVVQEARETEVELVKEERAKPEYVVQKVSALPVEDTEQLTQELEGEFGLLTGENPMAETMTEEENAALNQRAELWLRAKGYSPRRVSGKYGQAENSFFVPGLTKEDAIAFAKEFNQESVAHSEGLIYQDGSMNPRVKEDDNFSFSEFNNDSDFVSVVNTADGPRTFQVGYNFDTKVGEAPAKEAPAKKEAPKKKSKADTLKAAERGVQKFGEPFTKLVDNFNNLLSKLGGSNIPVYVVDGDTYKAVTGTSSRGTFRTIDGQRTIVVNADKATLGTVYHEMMHGYIVSMNLTPRQIVSFVNTIKAELKKGNATEKKLANQLERFQKEYINQEIYGKGLTLDDPNIAEEFAAEFVAQIKDNVDIDQMSVSTIDKIRLAVAKFINKTFKVNIDTTPIESRQEAFDFMNGFLDALEGRAAVAPKVNQTANPYQAQRSRLQIETPAGSKLFNSPLEDATTLARQYMASKGLEYREGKPFSDIDEARAKRISDAFDAMENDPTNPEVAAAYKAMAEETIEQYEFITKAGYKVEINNEEPYNNSGDMISDLRDNKRMKIFSTESGFGDEAITDKQRKENPLLQRTKYKDVNGQPLLVNDLFRFVHDFFGHAKRGNSFGPKGEENAWDVHSRMYTPMARRAMTSETRGQNSYVNFSGVNAEAFKLRDEARKLRREGKLEEANELTGKVYDMMTFAEQKVGLLPDEFVENDYDNPPSLTPQEEQGESGEVGTINIPKEQIEVIDSPKLSEDSRSFVQKFVTDIKMTALQGRRFVTNMYDYTNAGVTNLGNGLYIELFGGRNYVPMMMERNGVGLGDVSNLAAFNSKEQAEGFIRNATKGKADLFGPHSGGLEGSWQFQHHIFDSLVNLVLDNKILSKTELIDLFNTGLNTKGPAGGIKAFEKFNERNNSKLKNLNRFKKNPLELVELLNAENNYSPNLRKILNQKIASNKKFQKAIGVKNLNEFHNRISDPLNIGVSGGEIMTFVEFDPSTFKIVKTKPGDVNHHPSFGWVVMAKIKAIHHPDKYYKSYDITDSYTKHNVEGTVVENKSEATKKQFIESNVKSSAGAIAKIAEVDLPREQIDWQASLFGKGQVNPAIVNRNDVVQEAAYDLLTGKITNDEYQEVVRITQSIDPITQFFLPASTKDMADALDSNKGKLLNVQLEDGTEIGLRLDIPAYKNRNIWVVSIHDSGKAGKSLSYGSVAWATDVTFGSNPKVAAFIAAGQNLDTGKKQDKTTIARMHGKWKNFEGKTKEERDASAVKKVEEIVAIESSFAGAGRKGSPWRQIGMNPFRHSFFYDRRTGQPVIAAAEVVQIGGLVYAKDVVYADKNDPIFEVTGYKDANGETVRFQLEDQVNEERNNEETYESVEKNQEGLFDADLNAAVDNDVANSASWQERPRTLFEKFVDLTRLKIQDKFRNLIKIQEDIEYSSGKPVGLDEDFRNAEALMHGAAKEELNKTEEKVGVIAKLIKASGLTLERFNDLLYAMHAQERNRYLRVISTDVGKSLMDMRKKLEMKPSEVAELLGITTEQYNKIEANKIALKTSELRDVLLIYGTTPSRFFYDNAKVKNGSGMTDVEAREILAKYGLDLASPDVSQLKPRIRIAVQAVRDLTADTRRRLVEGGLESQDTIDAFNETYKNYVPLRGFAEGDVDSEIIEGGRKIEVRGREKRAKGRETKADSPLTQAIIANTTTIIRAEKNGVMTRFFNLAKNNPNKDVYEVVDPTITKEYKRELRNGKIITTAKTIADYMVDPKMVAVRIDGDYKFIRFKDQRLADAFRGANVVKAEWMVKYLGQFNRALSSFITTYDPEFVLRNFSRDIQTAVLNLFAEQEISEGLIKDKNIVANVVADTLPALKSIFAVEGGATGKKKASKNKEMDQYYREFKEDGARTEWFYSKSASEVQKDIEKLLEGKGESSLTAALNLVERINSSVENAVRLSSYVNARKAGIPRAKAAELAKNLTVNFNKSGEWGQIGNTLYLFFNASVQGTSRLIRSLKPRYIVDSEGNRKLQVTTAQKMAIGLSLMGSLMSLLNEGLSDDDEDDKSFYSKIPDFEKERNIIIMKPNGKDYWKIPLPYGVNVFYVAGTSLADAAQRIKTPGEAVVGIMEAAVGSFSPINFPSSGDFSKFVTKFITPTIGQIPASLAMNENYFGQTIYNENFPFDTSPKPESELGRKGGYRWTKELTRFLNKVSGGSEFRSGAIDINPDKIDFVLESLTGGMGKFVTRSANVIDKAITGNWDELEARQVPFLRVFYGQSPKYANVQEFYSRSVLVNQMQEEVKAKIITGPEAKRVSKMFYLGKNIRKRLSEIKKKEDAAKLIKDPVLQEERLDALEKLRYKLVADYNKQYERFEIDKLK